MTATFAVVGQPNKGKSSIVATLAENDAIPISPVPGTTRAADEFVFTIDGDPHYRLIDTPGFQRAKSVLDWLHAHESNASERASLVEAFVQAYANDERFHDECTLLRPILDGAGILYVVDGSKPYGAEFEVEMEILRWTGQPRMALINLIGAGDYLEEWRQALDQYFSIVRVFDAMQADFDARLNLLRAFGELDEHSRPAIDAAIAAMHGEREHRLRKSAAEIAACLTDCIRASVSSPLAEGTDVEATKNSLATRLMSTVRERETNAREEIQAIYRHERLQRDEVELGLLDTDLFARESWQLFGLSRTQLLVTGTVSGAIAGMGIDAVVGGASLLIGTAVGAIAGGVGTWFGADELAKVRVLGDPLGGNIVEVGPIKQANFPWVLLGRAWTHHRLVSERNHALREKLSLELEGSSSLMDEIHGDLRRSLNKTFINVRAAREDTEQFAELIRAVLDTPSASDATVAS